MDKHLRQICEPQKYLSVEEKEALYHSNQGILISEICFIVAYSIMTTFLPVRPLLHAAFFSLMLVSLISFYLLASRNIFLYKCIYTLLRLLFPLLCYLDKSAFIFSLLSLSLFPSLL